MMEILETDTPAVRLLKARTYLTAAGALLKRVIFVVVGLRHWTVSNHRLTKK